MKQRAERTEIKPRKRWIVIGPGIVLALILAIQIVIANRQKPSGPPIIERQVVNSGVTRSVQPAPEISYVLERREQLRLTEAQVDRLGALRREWQSRAEPLSSELDKAAADFNAFMRKSGSRATIGDIQSHAGPVSELSRQVSSLRRAYWEKACEVLNRRQRQAIDTELSHGYSPKSA